MCTKMKMLGMLVMCLAVVSVQADIINTWDGGTVSYYSVGTSSAITQSFTVPAGQTGTKVEIWIEKNGSYYQEAGYYTHVALYAPGSYDSPIAIKSWQWTNPYWKDLYGAFISASDTELNLAAGTYEIQVWGNTDMATARAYGRLHSGSTYAGGSARTGWAPGTEIAGGDFEAQITVVPEPATMLMLALGAGAAMIRRKR